jgi:hypothetical protein
MRFDELKPGTIYRDLADEYVVYVGPGEYGDPENGPVSVVVFQTLDEGLDPVGIGVECVAGDDAMIDLDETGAVLVSPRSTVMPQEQFDLLRSIADKPITLPNGVVKKIGDASLDELREARAALTGEAR